MIDIAQVSIERIVGTEQSGFLDIECSRLGFALVLEHAARRERQIAAQEDVGGHPVEGYEIRTTFGIDEPSEEFVADNDIQSLLNAKW